MPFDCRHQYVHGHDACVSACPTRAVGAAFSYLRVEDRDEAPRPEAATLDIAVLDMNHGWPNLGHDAVVHSLRHVACDLLEVLDRAGLRMRVTSYDVRRAGGVPRPDGHDGLIVVGTGGPGHIDPARNDGIDPGSQGIAEDPSWEPEVQALFDRQLADPEGVLLGICHTFGVMCRWRRLALPALRGDDKGGKSAGIQENLLTPDAQAHPWFRHLVADHGPRIEVLDSRLYDLVPDLPLPADALAIGYETLGPGGPAGPALTMLELARDPDGVMPRVLGVNHHPEIVNRPRQLALLRRRRARGDISDAWYEERRRTLMQTLDDRGGEQPLALTSSYSLHGPLRYHVTRQLRRLAGRRGVAATPHEHEIPVAMTRSGQVVSLAELEARSVIPQPPFASLLTETEERRRFEELKPRLNEVWDVLLRSENEPGTSVVVPSLTLDQDELRKLEGAAFYEERLLFLLIRLRNPRAHVVYVTSQPVHPLILDYYLHLLAGVPASHARARLTMLCTYDSSPRPLTQKILERPRLIERIRSAIPDPSRSYLTVFNSTPLERRLAVLLGVPLNGLDPDLNYLGTKSGSRKVFREAKVELPLGFEDLTGEADVEDALIELRRERPGLRKAVVKLNDSFSGEGNAIFRFPEPADDKPALRKALRDLEFSVPWETHQNFFQKFTRMGGIVEEFIDAPFKVSPSAQLRTSPRGEVLPISTHDQILGGPSGQVYQGCSFPAHDGYRMAMQERSLQIGAVLARYGVVSRFGVDFLAFRDTEDEPWKLTALEINLRVVGTTHPFLALQFLTGGTLDPQTGQFMSLSGRAKYYMATDNLRASTYRGVLPEDLIDIVTDNSLHYSHRTESGVLFHLIGALSEYGKLGLTVIASSPDEVQDLYGRTLEVLARETSIGHGEERAP